MYKSLKEYMSKKVELKLHQVPGLYELPPELPHHSNTASCTRSAAVVDFTLANIAETRYFISCHGVDVACSPSS